MTVLCTQQIFSQTPAHFYWKTLAGANGVPLIVESINGNTNPFDPSHNVNPGAYVNATMAMVGYAKFLPLFDRATMISVIFPMGHISSRNYNSWSELLNKLQKVLVTRCLNSI